MRNSDRLATPAVVITLLLVGMVLVGLTIVGVTYLAARGIDPGPVLDLPAKVAVALSGVISVVLQLVNRTTIAKTEQQAGQANAAVQQQASHLQTLTNAVYDVSDALPRPVRSSYEDTLLQRTAPAPPGR
jgi:hypothetical protein